MSLRVLAVIPASIVACLAIASTDRPDTSPTVPPWWEAFDETCEVGPLVNQPLILFPSPAEWNDPSWKYAPPVGATPEQIQCLDEAWRDYLACVRWGMPELAPQNPHEVACDVIWDCYTAYDAAALACMDD